MRVPALLRQAAERLSRGIVLERVLPDRLGGATLRVSPDVALKYWRRSLEGCDEGLFELAAELVEPGDVVWDIGASVGLFAFAAAHRAGAEGRVVAVEPDGWVAGLLRRSAEGLPHRYAPVEVLEAAVAERPGRTEFIVAARGRAGSHLAGVGGWTQTGGERRTVTVEVVSLDDLLDRFPAPQVVKIDVEGAEGPALDGGERLWQEVRPLVLCEIGDPESRRGWPRLVAAGNEMLDAALTAAEREPLISPTWNTLFVPEESPRAERLRARRAG